jgi:hypothetical protein
VSLWDELERGDEHVDEHEYEYEYEYDRVRLDPRP